MKEYEMVKNRIRQLERNLRETEKALQKHYSALSDAIADIYKEEIAELKQKIELLK